MVGNEPFEFGQRHPRELRRDGDDHDVGIRHGLGAVTRRGHVVRQLLHAGQAHAVVMVVADSLDDLRFDGPHGHVIARVGKHPSESRSPSTCAQHRYIRHIRSLDCCGLAFKVSALMLPPTTHTQITAARVRVRLCGLHARPTLPSPGSWCGNPNIRRGPARRGSPP